MYRNNFIGERIQKKNGNGRLYKVWVRKNNYHFDMTELLFLKNLSGKKFFFSVENWIFRKLKQILPDKK